MRACTIASSLDCKKRKIHGIIYFGLFIPFTSFCFCRSAWVSFSLPRKPRVRFTPGCHPPPHPASARVGLRTAGGSSGFDIRRRILRSLAVLKTSGKRVGYRPKLRDDSGTVVSPFFFNPSFSGPHVVTTFRTGCVQQCQQSCQDPF